MRIEKILCTVLDEDHERQVEDVMDLSKRDLKEPTGATWIELYSGVR
jgi:hypothetical protein